MKSMQFHQLSKIALPIVKDCLILVLILVTRSLHVLPLNETETDKSLSSDIEDLLF